VTNQEPGAPEPLTSEEERGLRAMIGDAEVAHVGASYVRRLLATLDRDRAPLSAGLREALANMDDNARTWREAMANEADMKDQPLPASYPYKVAAARADAYERSARWLRAALSHPESDTPTEGGEA
jgi:hypothetical protein